MDIEPRIQLLLQQKHFDYIMNLLGTAMLRYVDTAPIIQDIAQQRQGTQLTQVTQKPNGAEVTQ